MIAPLLFPRTQRNEARRRLEVDLPFVRQKLENRRVQEQSANLTRQRGFVEAEVGPRLHLGQTREALAHQLEGAEQFRRDRRRASFVVSLADRKGHQTGSRLRGHRPN